MSADFSNLTAKGLTDEGTYTPDNLFGGKDMVTRLVTIDTGNLARGSVLGKITATGKYVLSASAASDGSQVPDAILLEPADASSADAQAVVAIAGRGFNQAALILGAGHTLASIADALRDKNIYFESVIG